MKKKLGKILTLTFLALSLSGGLNPSFAEIGKQSASADQGVFTLGEIVVTGEDERVTEITTNETISMEDIRLSGSRNLGDALSNLPGVFPTIGTKNEYYFTVRGFNQRYVPIYYDGIPISVPNDGFVDAGVLTTDNLSRITLSKGVSSVLYGCNTMGGVINMVSRKPEKAFEGDLTLGAWEVDGYRAAANFGARQEKWYLAIGAGYLEQRTFNLSSDFDNARNERKDTRNNASRETTNASLKVGWTPAPGHEYALGVNVVEAERDVPPHAFAASGRELKFWRFTNWDKLTTYFIGDSQLLDGLELKTRLFRDDYENTLKAYDNASYNSQKAKSAFTSTYDDYSWGGSFTLRSRQLKNQNLSLAFHFKEDIHREQGDRGDPWERYEARTFSLGLENDLRLTDYLSLVLGCSYDLQDPRYANGCRVRDDDDSFNPQIGLRWALNDNTVLHASVGAKTRFPTLNELYSSYLGSTLPNPDLEKETAVNYELGIEQNFGGHTQVSLALFYSDVEDLITRRVLPAGDMYDNVGKSRFQGIEVALRSTLLPRQEINLSYTYLDAEDRSAGRSSDHLEEVSENKVYLSDVITITDRVRFFTELQWNDERWEQDINGNWKNIDGFFLADAKVMVKLPGNLELETGIHNLFDKDYELSVGFPQAGRTAFAEIKYSF
ncbi:MAG: TonB-dependent receptor [Deltaproteobacteria bacterium]|nr:TonB-dependent receptor [Deltaproteobacteria bacterium]